MAYKATGKPRGRPKTKEYTTVVARIPTDLASRVKLYAEEHGDISLAMVIRDGLILVLGEVDGREVPEASKRVDSAHAWEELRELVERQQMQLQALTQAIEQMRTTLDKRYR